MKGGCGGNVRNLDVVGWAEGGADREAGEEQGSHISKRGRQRLPTNLPKGVARLGRVHMAIEENKARLEFALDFGFL